MPTYRDLLRFAHTGIASPDMTHFDKTRALAALGGGTVQTLTGQPPLSFKADGTPLISWSMKGNGSQQGAPTPDAPIMPEFVGTLDGADWKIPLTCAGQTVPVYLGQVSTVRKIRKLVLDGTENWQGGTKLDSVYRHYIRLSDSITSTSPDSFCTHLPWSRVSGGTTNHWYCTDTRYFYFFTTDDIAASLQEWKSYLAAQYSAGTPVTVWYVLAEPETAIVNEPLCKIGDYVDELHSTDAAVTIPTAKGQNTLTVESDLPPSEMTVTYRG